MSQIAETKKPIKPEWSTPRLTPLLNLVEAEAPKSFIAGETTTQMGGGPVFYGPLS